MHPARLECRHGGFTALTTIPAHQRRALILRQTLDQFDQPRQRSVRLALVARRNRNTQHQPQSRYLVGVVGMRGAPRFVRVVTHHRTFLLSI